MPQEHFVYLAREQIKRLHLFREAHTDMKEMDIRQAFFGQRYEAHITHSITRDIDELSTSGELIFRKID